MHRSLHKAVAAPKEGQSRQIRVYGLALGFNEVCEVWGGKPSLLKRLGFKV